MNTFFAEIDMWRARVQGEFNPRPLPMIRVTTAPKALRMLSKDIEDELDQRHRSWIWFYDRAGWRSAWRVARIIASGRRVNKSLINAEAGRVAFSINPSHYAAPVRVSAPRR